VALPHRFPRRVRVLGLESDVPRSNAFLGVHHVDDLAVGQGQPGRGFGDQSGDRGLVDGGEDHAQ